MEKAGDILKKFFNAHDFSRSQMYSNFFNGWEAIIGEKLSGHSRILDIIDQILIIEVDHPGVLQILSMKKKMILYKINKKYPELRINRLKFRVKFEADKGKILLQKKSLVYKEKKVKENMEKIKNVDSTDLRNLLNKLYNSVLNKQMRVDKNK